MNIAIWFCLKAAKTNVMEKQVKCSSATLKLFPPNQHLFRFTET